MNTLFLKHAKVTWAVLSIIGGVNGNTTPIPHPSSPDCIVLNPWFVGDVFCHVDYNTEKCGRDGGDCEEFNSQYPN